MKRFLFLFTIPLSAFATMFIPVSLEQQLKESDAVVRGNYIGKGSKLIGNDGEIVTEYIFKLTNSSGIKNNQLINSNEFKFLVPGGEWQGQIQRIEGAPHFDTSKEYVLLINQEKSNYWLHNLSLGSFNLIKENKIEYIESMVFPNHPQFGKISYENFLNEVEKRFNDKFAVVEYNDMHIAKTESDDDLELSNHKAQNIDRTVASSSAKKIEDNQNEQSEDKFQIFWILIIFVLMGTYYKYLTAKNSEK